jgi:hypothetical protein
MCRETRNFVSVFRRVENVDKNKLSLGQMMRMLSFFGTADFSIVSYTPKSWRTLVYDHG